MKYGILPNACIVVVLGLGACAEASSRGPGAGYGPGIASAGNGESGGDSNDVGDDDEDDDDDAGGGERLDLPPPEDRDGCYAADLLFVIDNSGSMCDAQAGLAEVIPELVDTMFDTLPAGTDLHVGVVTTSFSHGGSHKETQCRAAEGPADIEDAYIVDSLVDRNGYQGRLFEHDDVAYFSANTASEEDRAPLEEWFAGAVLAVGCDGGAFEFPAAAASYAVDVANADTNDGFVRDEGAALAIFILTNETDQSPETLEAYRQRVIDAKSGCGGEECIFTAGLLATNCVPDSDPMVWQFLSAFGSAPVWGDIYDYEGYGDVVAGALAEGIVDKCDEIEPAG